MKVLCDDYKTVYVDGKEMQLTPGAQGWNSIATFEIPATSSIIGIKCMDYGGGHGIRVKVVEESGKVVLTSDDNHTWRCSKEEQSSKSWTEEDFQEDQSWKQAVVTPSYNKKWNENPLAFTEKVIWTSSIASEQIETVYCRSLLPKGIKFFCWCHYKIGRMSSET